jgi:hypothetical protein
MYVCMYVINTFTRPLWDIFFFDVSKERQREQSPNFLQNIRSKMIKITIELCPKNIVLKFIYFSTLTMNTSYIFFIIISLHLENVSGI